MFSWEFCEIFEKTFYIISPEDYFFTSTVGKVWPKLFPRHSAEAYLEPRQTSKIELLGSSGSAILQKCSGGLRLHKNFEK